jgi:cytochrome c oxidase cbb3-type subunit 3
MNERDDDRLLGHDYDGIQEYDNKLPNWWLWILYGSIIFSVLYWLFFHTFDVGLQPSERYKVEMIKAAEEQLARMGDSELTDESLSLMATIPTRVEQGRQVFEQFCVVCHGTQGEGTVGPNLTDAYWIHGGKPTKIHETVTHGVLEKGMAAWGNQLGPARVQAVVAYVLTIKGQNVAGKAPEGEEELPEEAAPESPAEGEEAPAEMEGASEEA